MAESIKTADQEHVKTVTEVRNIAADFTDVLDPGEKFSTGSLDITVRPVDDPDGIDVTEKTFNSEDTVINGRPVLANQGVTFRVSGGLAGGEYTLLIAADTDAGQHVTGRLILKVEPDFL
jgi:hypothetical protein